jgi:hypothetical protein
MKPLALLAWSLYLAAFIAGILNWPDLQPALIFMIFAALTQIIGGAFTCAQREADHIIAREEAKE